MIVAGCFLILAVILAVAFRPTPRVDRSERLDRAETWAKAKITYGTPKTYDYAKAKAAALKAKRRTASGRLLPKPGTTLPKQGTPATVTPIAAGRRTR